MSDKTVVDVPVPSAKRVALYRSIVDAQFTERANWTAVIEDGQIAIEVDGKKTENPANKTLCAGQFCVIYAERHASGHSKESKEYKDAIKNGRAHFSTCVNRTLVKMGNRPETVRGKGSRNPTQTPQQGQAQPSQQAVAFTAGVMSLVHEAVRLTANTFSALAQFQAEAKLTKAQTAAIKLIADHAQTAADSVVSIETALVAGNVPADPATALSEALKASIKPSNGAAPAPTVQ